MTNKLGYEALKQKIKKLRKEILQLRAENARLRKVFAPVVKVKRIALPGKQTVVADGNRCSCGLRLFNGKCVSCKPKNQPLSTF